MTYSLNTPYNWNQTTDYNLNIPYKWDQTAGYSLNTPYDWNQTVGYQYNSSSALGSGKNNMFPELLIGGLGALFGGIGEGYAAEQQAAGMIGAANINAQAQRDAAFTNLLAGQYALTGSKQFDRFEQQKAADYQQAFLEPRKIQLASEDRLRSISDTLSPGAQKLRWQANVDKMNQSLANARAVTDAMFGPVAQQPFQYGNIPGYAAS